MSFGPGAAYLVDVLHSRSAESLAANRSVFFLVLFCLFFSMEFEADMNLKTLG